MSSTRPVRLPQILPVLLAILAAAAPVAAGEIELRRVGSELLEVAGGSGTQAWAIRYGTFPEGTGKEPGLAVQTAAAEGDRAWFSHGPWLRLIDTRRGVVLGRWRFPSGIVGLKPAGSRVEVEILDSFSKEDTFRQTVLFDPAAPHRFNWRFNNMMLQRTARNEASILGSLSFREITAEDRQRLAQVEQTLARDAFSPQIFLAHGRLLQAAGDARYRASFERAVRLPGADFTELLPIAGMLEMFGEPGLAGEAFERGYRDFWQRGNDPRLLTVLINRLWLYALDSGAEGFSGERRQELSERFYRLSPYGEAAEYAWRLQAAYLAGTASPEQARLWDERARDAESRARFAGHWFFSVLDHGILLIAAGVLGLVFYLLVIHLRYRGQRKLDRAARRQGPAVGRSFFGLEYWSRGDRLGFLLMVLVVWMATGLAALGSEGVLHYFSMPFSMGAGNLAGPVNAWFLENKLPASPHRDLLLAVSFHQSGERERAEALYRSLPQFAEAWNNLGVLLKQTGRQAEAQQAFQRAMEADSSLAEAALNLGRPPSTLWTQLHQEYNPGQPMLAPPTRPHMEKAAVNLNARRLGLALLGGPLRIESARAAAVISGVSSFGLWPTALFVLAFALALALVLVIPGREVTVPPGRSQVVWEALFPGTSPVYGTLGGLVLLVWFYLLEQNFLILSVSTARLITTLALPNVARLYGAPVDFQAELYRVGGLVNPGWLWVLVIPVLLFAVNLFVVWRSRRAA